MGRGHELAKSSLQIAGPTAPSTEIRALRTPVFLLPAPSLFLGSRGWGEGEGVGEQTSDPAIGHGWGDNQLPPQRVSSCPLKLLRMRTVTPPPCDVSQESLRPALSFSLCALG